jgi:hypothetical protein
MSSNSITVTDENVAEITEAAAQATAEFEGADVPASNEELIEPGAAPEVTEAGAVKAKDTLEIETPTEVSEDEAPEEGDEPEVPEGIDMAKYSAEFAETGELSEESTGHIVDRLEKAGFTDAEDLLAGYIAGSVSQSEKAQAVAHDVVGGKDNYVEMVTWAKDALTPGQIESYNAAASDPNMLEMAVAGLNAQYLSAGKTFSDPTPATEYTTPAPARVAAGANTSGAVAPITSTEQLAALVSTTQYQNDPVHRAKVDERINASMRTGRI